MASERHLLLICFKNESSRDQRENALCAMDRNPSLNLSHIRQRPRTPEHRWRYEARLEQGELTRVIAALAALTCIDAVGEYRPETHLSPGRVQAVSTQLDQSLVLA